MKKSKIKILINRIETYLTYMADPKSDHRIFVKVISQAFNDMYHPEYTNECIRFLKDPENVYVLHIGVDPEEIGRMVDVLLKIKDDELAEHIKQYQEAMKCITNGI